MLLAEQSAAQSLNSAPRPIVSHECSYCDWWHTCRPQLDDDDLSLRISKSPLDRYEIAGLRMAGVSTVAELAAADLDTLMPLYLPSVGHRDGAEDRLRIVHRRSRLLSTGSELDRLRQGPIAVPSAQLEIDIDIETSRTDRVYLWGFWVSGPGESHYRHFSDFSELDDAGEVALARNAMAWLREVVAGQGALVFHYSGHGSQVRDTEGDELEDGKDEIICPWDFNWEDGFIKDDDFDTAFAGLNTGYIFWGALALVVVVLLAVVAKLLPKPPAA